MAVCKMNKQATLFLILLSFPLLLLIANSPLKCEPLDRWGGSVRQERGTASKEWRRKQGVPTVFICTPTLNGLYLRCRKCATVHKSPFKGEFHAAILPAGIQ